MGFVFPFIIVFLVGDMHKISSTTATLAHATPILEQIMIMSKMAAL